MGLIIISDVVFKVVITILILFGITIFLPLLVRRVARSWYDEKHRYLKSMLHSKIDPSDRGSKGSNKIQ